MSALFPVLAPDLIRRRVLFAVALVDPITGRLVSRGLRVTADGLAGRPVVNHSGHFVWLSEGAARPTRVRVAPDGAPFEPESIAVGVLPDPAPDDPQLPPVTVDPSLRRLRIPLRPTPAYPFPDGVTLVHGRLKETTAADAAAVANAEVEPQWQLDDAATWKSSAARARTGATGEFTGALLLPADAKPEGDSGKIAMRVVFDRAGVRKATPAGSVAPGSRVATPGGTPLFGVVAWDQLLNL
jgi:hypothetical protein